MYRWSEFAAIHISLGARKKIAIIPSYVNPKNYQQRSAALQAGGPTQFCATVGNPGRGGK
jgi:hypothetical protein